MYIAQTNSTNTYLKQHPEVEDVYAGFQSSGRGQAGNGWESEPGKNVLLSVRLHPMTVLASNQWQVCMAVSVALWQTVKAYLDDSSKLTIKWPNDLYYGDQKLAGVLIEHTLNGDFISESVVGIGLNVNQMQWNESVPNPISMKQITGKEYRIDNLATQLIVNLHNIDITSADYVNLYMQHLYRRNGWWWWEEREVSVAPTMNGERSEKSFEATIKGINQQGELILLTQMGEEKTYHFKQIKYIL